MLTDYDMPGMKGADLCRRLRQDSRFDRTAIILMTCFGRDLAMKRLRDELQLAAILEKPFQSSELLRTIKECLGAEDADLGEIFDSVANTAPRSVRNDLSRFMTKLTGHV